MNERIYVDEKTVFNINNDKYIKNIINAINEAIKNKYQFLLFNNIIYFIDDLGIAHKTKIKISH
ncbi:hypothetical protein REO35_04240 [Clostridium perfringens]|uniref:Uncharacterized protein n=1 Tax=Clostridium perfringens E str. JGS1987 TaxID=451755 RepID=B1BPS4_CLOPF|nr:hypothetical protein [Clostridium perfringens]EDT16223.1 hypothetical protein AC3_2539 [Clostridium perfringens E str. JGS1987]MDK0669361.1 hypothetical protein [Clostridium perfringens]MDT7986916.1 hypothetical protein [Clostridium perfringens]